MVENIKPIVTRPVFSQVLSGLAYSAVGLFVIFVVGSLLPLSGYPKHLMPPSEGFSIQFLQRALFQYAFENEGRYPKDLRELLGKGYAVEKDPKRVALIHSTNLEYFPPAEPIRDPYAEENKNKALLTYETERWIFSITVGSDFSYRRKESK